MSAASGQREELLRTQLDTLENFASSLASTLGHTDIFAYLERWEKISLESLADHLTPQELKKIQNVRLEQRFELSNEEQIQQLVAGFTKALKHLLAE